jgi:Flp pilus assembly protein TadD
MKKIDVNFLEPSQQQLNILLGYFQAGRYADAEKLSLSITQEFPKQQFPWKVLGAALKQMGKINESLVATQKSVQLDPQDVEAHNNLGVLLQELGRLNEAETSYRQAITLKPDLAEAHSNLGNTLKELGRLDEAEVSYKKAIELKPNYTETHNNLGITLHELGRLDEAETSYRQAITSKPDYAEAHNNLGVLLQELGRLNEAEKSYRQAITLKPDYAEAHNNLGIILQKLGRLDEAEVSCRQAITLKPNYAEAHSNLGIILQELGRLDEAEVSCRQAITLKPNYAEAHFNLGMVLFSMSDFKNGLIQYEWRKKLPKNINNNNNIKGLEWQGENLNNKTILILSEQGIGDIIQFSRYIYLIEKEYSVNIIFKTYKRMPYLFSKSKFKIIFNEDNIPKYDFYKHLMSLPKIYYEKTKTFPSQINFIPKDKKIALKWKERLNEIKGFKVGINWQGSKTNKSDHLRSIPLNYFNDLFNIEKINFISLQKGFGVEQIKNFKHKDKLYDFSKEVDNGENIFEDTIGILQNIDLVISIDSSLVHLSSTLGIKTFALLHFCPDWRWNLITKEFSWYDNLKIYRQEEINKWDSIFSLLKKDLVAYEQKT